MVRNFGLKTEVKRVPLFKGEINVVWYEGSVLETKSKCQKSCGVAGGVGTHSQLLTTSTNYLKIKALPF